jgi:uncharacterized protein YxeA
MSIPRKERPMKIALAALILAGSIATPKAEAYDRCAHYVRAYVSYAKAGRMAAAKKELQKAEKEGCMVR